MTADGHRQVQQDRMRYGAVIPAGTATEQLELAVAAERAGWDGVFAWEAAYGVDPWGLLSAIAVRTSRVRLRSEEHTSELQSRP